MLSDICYTSCFAGYSWGPVDRAKVSEELAKEEDGVEKGSVEGVVSKDLL